MAWRRNNDLAEVTRAAAKGHQLELIAARRGETVDELDIEVDRFVARLVSMPELAVSMTKTQLRAYARINTLGDASETDGDMLQRALRSEDAAGKFSLPDSGK